MLENEPGEPRANSSLQPTACRSLARRFRASFCATLRVALPESEGTWRLSERTLAGSSREQLGELDLVLRPLGVMEDRSVS